MAHFAHYLRRNIVQHDGLVESHPWFAEDQPEDQGFMFPRYHVTRATTGPSARVRRGDTIWLFSQLFSPWGKLPPALDARIIVESVVKRSDSAGFRYKAGNGSSWFPILDATTLIVKLQTKDSAGQIRPLLSSPKQPIGQALRRMRELENPATIERHANHLAEKKFDFVSYRLKDGTETAYQKVAQLVSKRHAVFWDRWSLPRRLVEKRELLSDEALDRYIKKQIKMAFVVWGIETPMYSEAKSYSEKERELASKLKKLKMVVSS